MAGTDNLERAIDELYVAPPEGFTESRNSLAKRLKDGGDTKGAARVRGLRKPVRAAWAVNQLVSQDRAGVKELIAAGGRLRAAQRRAMSTKGGRRTSGEIRRARQTAERAHAPSCGCARRGAACGRDRGDRRDARGRVGG